MMEARLAKVRQRKLKQQLGPSEDDVGGPRYVIYRPCYLYSQTPRQYKEPVAVLQGERTPPLPLTTQGVSGLGQAPCYAHVIYKAMCHVHS